MIGAPFFDASFADVLDMSPRVSGRRLGSRWGRGWEVGIDCGDERKRILTHSMTQCKQGKHTVRRNNYIA